MSTKYYRCKVDNFMWDEGAIISSEGSGYRTVHELHEHVPLGGEYISDYIIEHPDNEKFFEKVYKVDLLTKVVYETKDKAKELLAKNFKANK